MIFKYDFYIMKVNKDTKMTRMKFLKKCLFWGK